MPWHNEAFIRAEFALWQHLATKADILEPRAYKERLAALTAHAHILEFFDATQTHDPEFLAHSVPLAGAMQCANAGVIAELRAFIVSEAFNPNAFLERILAFSGFAFTPGQLGTHYLPVCIDELVGTILCAEAHPSLAHNDGSDEVPAELGVKLEVKLEHEQVHHEITPVGAILELACFLKSCPQSTVFCDIGAGSGLVGVLVHLLTQVPVIGLEIQAPLVNAARAQVDFFKLKNIEFHAGDALNWDISHGTVFFLFTPFFGSVMDRFLARLQELVRNLKEGKLSTQRNSSIHIVTFGDCTMRIAKEPWLRVTHPDMVHRFRLAVFEST